VATTIAYLDRGCLQTAVKPIRLELGLDKDQMGLVLSSFFLAYAVLQMPTAWLGHVWGTRWALPFFAIVWSAAIGLCGTAEGFATLLFWRFVMGAAEAGIFPCAMASLGRWFPDNRRAWVSGVLGSFMGVGGGLGTGLTALLLVHFTWRAVFVLYALPGLVWAVWFFLWFRDSPADHPAVNREELFLIEGSHAQVTHQDAAASPTPWATILGSVTMWWLSLQQFFRAAGYIFFMSWFTTYLEETYGISLERAGELAALPHAGMLVGALAGGMIADAILVWTGSRRLSRQGLAIISLTICGMLALFSGAIADPVLAVAVITLGAFFSSLAGPVAYAMTIDLGGRHVAPVFGLMNMSGNVGAILFPAVAPRLVRWTGNWDVVLFVFAAMHVFAAGCWIFLDPNRAIFPDPASRESKRPERIDN